MQFLLRRCGQPRCRTIQHTNGTVQNCIDLAAHIFSEQGLGVPASYNEMFYILEENGYFEKELTEKLVKAVGFRNLIVHE